MDEKPLAEVASTGDRLKTLEALRDRLAAQIDECHSMRDLPALSKQLTDVMRQIEAIPKEEEVSPLARIKKRRADRRANASAQARSDLDNERMGGSPGSQ